MKVHVIHPRYLLYQSKRPHFEFDDRGKEYVGFDRTFQKNR